MTLRRLQIAVTFAILSMGKLLFAAEPADVELQNLIDAIKDKHKPKPAATVVIPPTILPRDETPVAPIVPFQTPGVWSNIDIDGDGDIDNDDSGEPTFTIDCSELADAKPTPWAGVAAMLKAADLRGDMSILDPGCGPEARVLIEACRRFPQWTGKATGVDWSRNFAEAARREVAAAGLSDRIEIITGDSLTLNIKADVCFLYMWEEFLAAYRPQIDKNFRRIISYAHPVPGLGGIPWPGDIYVYSHPKPQVQDQPQSRLVQPSFATWNGRQYSRAKSGCNCPMCQSIRAQLQPRYVTTTAPQVQAAPARSGHWETRCSYGLFGRKTCSRVWVED